MKRMFYMDPMYFESWKHEDVTLATQCSANHLHHVVMQITRLGCQQDFGGFQNRRNRTMYETSMKLELMNFFVLFEKVATLSQVVGTDFCRSFCSK